MAASRTFQAEACENLAIYYEHRAKRSQQSSELVEYAISQAEGRSKPKAVRHWIGGCMASSPGEKIARLLIPLEPDFRAFIFDTGDLLNSRASAVLDVNVIFLQLLQYEIAVDASLASISFCSVFEDVFVLCNL